MTREEIANDIINTLFECTHSGEDDTISDKEFAEVLADKFINHEADLLKEFVEWYGEQVARDRNGRPIARVVASLDEWVEWFLEERK